MQSGRQASGCLQGADSLVPAGRTGGPGIRLLPQGHVGASPSPAGVPLGRLEKTPSLGKGGPARRAIRLSPGLRQGEAGLYS